MKLLPRLLFCMLLPATAVPVSACIWYQGTTLEGGFTRPERVRELSAGPLLGDRPQYIPAPEGGMQANTAGLLRAAIDRGPDFLLQNPYQHPLPPGWPPGMDQAVELIFSGDAAAAVTRLTGLNDLIPDNYWICANLGAACELSGDVPSALRWVEKAMALKPDAHEGTEWMHAAVLRARLALAKEPAWLRTHTISGLPQGDVPARFTLRDGAQTLTLKDIQRALVAHTFARLLFVKPKDVIAATLLTELAHVEARLYAVENGVALLDLADEYGAEDTGTIRRRWQSLQPGSLRMFLNRNAFESTVVGIAFLLISLAVGRYVYCRKQNVKKISSLSQI